MKGGNIIGRENVYKVTPLFIFVTSKRVAAEKEEKKKKSAKRESHMASVLRGHHFNSQCQEKSVSLPIHYPLKRRKCGGNSEVVWGEKRVCGRGGKKTGNQLLKERGLGNLRKKKAVIRADSEWVMSIRGSPTLSPLMVAVSRPDTLSKFGLIPGHARPVMWHSNEPSKDLMTPF